MTTRTPEDESARLRGTAVRAARGVKKLLLGGFRSSMQIDFKVDLHDLVTEYDRASEEAIVATILAEVPDSTIVGEEGGSRGDGRVHWHIDPIDGTANFARGHAHWCVSIAAIIEGRVVAGVIYNPMTDDVFSADLTGAWHGERPMRSRGAREERDAMLISVFPNTRDTRRFGSQITDDFRGLVEAFRTVRVVGSSALNLAHVAVGWADATMAFGTSSWDISAGVLIVEQAGGRFHGLDAGEPVAEKQSAPDYYATVAGAEYPTLAEIVHRNSAQHPVNGVKY